MNDIVHFRGNENIQYYVYGKREYMGTCQKGLFDMGK